MLKLDGRHIENSRFSILDSFYPGGLMLYGPPPVGSALLLSLSPDRRPLRLSFMRTTWAFHSAGQLVFGPHAVDQLGELAVRMKS